MHNGNVDNFQTTLRKLLETVCNEAFSNVYGSTDSEHLFAVIINELLIHSETSDFDIAAALDRVIERINSIVNTYGKGEPSYLNVAIADGNHAVVSR